jgi:hypothetical protein
MSQHLTGSRSAMDSIQMSRLVGLPFGSSFSDSSVGWSLLPRSTTVRGGIDDPELVPWQPPFASLLV